MRPDASEADEGGDRRAPVRLPPWTSDLSASGPSNSIWCRRASPRSTWPSSRSWATARCGSPRRSARAVRLRHPAARRRHDHRRRHRHRLDLGPRRHDHERGPQDGERGLPRPVPAGHGRQPPAHGRRRQGHDLRQAVLAHGRVPRRHGRGLFFAAEPRRGAPEGPGRARAADAGARRRAHRRRPPVLRAPRAHRVRPRALGDGPCSPPSRPSSSTTDPAKARAIARPTWPTYLGLPNYTNNLQRLGISRRRPGRPAAATAWSTPSWPGATSTPSSPASRPTSTPGADHVCVQVIAEDGSAVPIDAWRQLAPALIG